VDAAKVATLKPLGKVRIQLNETSRKICNIVKKITIKNEAEVPQKAPYRRRIQTMGSMEREA
jgi:hypothetical protein